MCTHTHTHTLVGFAFGVGSHSPCPVPRAGVPLAYASRHVTSDAPPEGITARTAPASAPNSLAPTLPHTSPVPHATRSVSPSPSHTAYISLSISTHMYLCIYIYTHVSTYPCAQHRTDRLRPNSPDTRAPKNKSGRAAVFPLGGWNNKY